MSNHVQQAVTAERVRMDQALSPDRLTGHEMEPAYARWHEIGLAVLELQATQRRTDPYLAATATSTQVQPSPEVTQYAAAQEFQGVVSGIDPAYTAAITAPQDVVDMPVAPVMQPQIEQRY